MITNAFKSFELMAKLLEKAVADGNNSKNATIVVSLKYLNILWQLLELRLINCKGELKLKWMKHCVLASSGLKNNMLTLTKLFLLSKTQNYISLLSYYLLKTTKTIATS